MVSRRDISKDARMPVSEAGAGRVPKDLEAQEHQQVLA
ncbi:MAG: hypothetical protein H6Q05_4288 [Acidobacteria bacterium]|nr:hypothetical protein [Acidobacteriota bacterium]